MKAFMSLHSNYCPIVWILHNRGFNNKIDKIDEQSLRIVYGDKKSNLEGLLRKDKSVKIHHKNLQVLATKICKTKHRLSPQITKNVFELNPLMPGGSRKVTHRFIPISKCTVCAP